MAPEPREIAKGIKRESRRQGIRNDGTLSFDGVADYDRQAGLGQQESASLWHAIRALLDRDDGYIRIIPDGAGKSVYWKWKFSRGEWKGHYVMVVVLTHEIAKAARLLQQKVDEVDVGLKRPARDTAYDA